MGELFLGISAGLVVSMINKYILSGTLWAWCRHMREDDDCDDLSSQSSAVSLDVHIHH